MTYYNIEELKQLVLCAILDVSCIVCPLHGTHLRGVEDGVEIICLISLLSFLIKSETCVVRGASLFSHM
jgi:hypothetical protein